MNCLYPFQDTYFWISTRFFVWTAIWRLVWNQNAKIGELFVKWSYENNSFRWRLLNEDYNKSKCWYQIIKKKLSLKCDLMEFNQKINYIVNCQVLLPIINHHHKTKLSQVFVVVLLVVYNLTNFVDLGLTQSAQETDAECCPGDTFSTNILPEATRTLDSWPAVCWRSTAASKLNWANGKRW